MYVRTTCVISAFICTGTALSPSFPPALSVTPSSAPSPTSSTESSRGRLTTQQAIQITVPIVVVVLVLAAAIVITVVIIMYLKYRCVCVCVCVCVCCISLERLLFPHSQDCEATRPDSHRCTRGTWRGAQVLRLHRGDKIL